MKRSKNFTLDDIEITNGEVVGDLEPTGGEAEVYTFSVSVVRGNVTVTLPAGAAVGKNGPSQLAVAIIHYIGPKKPTTTLTSNFLPTINNSVIVTAEFSEAIEELVANEHRHYQWGH